MIKHIKLQIVLGLSLLLSSVLLYLAQVEIFHDSRNTFFYLFQDLAFIPIQVLIVTLILNQLLIAREKIAKLHKIYMIIGVFFSEIGTELMKSLVGDDRHSDQIRNDLMINGDWTVSEFSRASKRIKTHDAKILWDQEDLTRLQNLLAQKRGFLTGLLQTPNLLEHETFTDLLLAVFHLADELSYRPQECHLSENDCQHLSGDMKRAYLLLISEWLAYLKHLKENYPYLYSLALRTNPFDPNASPVFK